MAVSKTTIARPPPLAPFPKAGSAPTLKRLSNASPAAAPDTKVGPAKQTAKSPPFACRKPVAKVITNQQEKTDDEKHKSEKVEGATHVASTQPSTENTLLGSAFRLQVIGWVVI